MLCVGLKPFGVTALSFYCVCACGKGLAWVGGRGWLSMRYSYLSVSIGSKRAAFNAGYMLNKTPHAIENEMMMVILLMSTTVGISLK